MTGLSEEEEAARLDPWSPLDLTHFARRDQSFSPSDFYPGLLTDYTRGLTLTAVPVGVDVLVVYYNQDLFDECGVDYPQIGWTWADFLDAAGALRDPEAGVFGYASADPLDRLPFLYRHSPALDEGSQAPAFGDALNLKALQWYADLFHVYDVAPTPSEAVAVFGCDEEEEAFSSQSVMFSHSCESRGIREGRVGMWVGWLAGSRSWSPDWHYGGWGVVSIPGTTQPVTWVSSASFFVSEKTNDPEACWEFVSYLSQQLPPVGIPARRSLAESPEYEQQAGSDVAAVARASMEQAIPEPTFRTASTLSTTGRWAKS